MKNRRKIGWLLALTPLLFACGKSSETNLVIANGEMPSWEMQATANYYLNYRKESFTSDGFDGKSNNLLFTQQKITCPAKLTPPTSNPTRASYDFTGWYSDETCTTLWDFANASATTSVSLFAGWSLTGEGSYVEPTYSPTIPVDDSLSSNLRLDGILNVAPISGTVYLTQGGLLRLANSPKNVAFALNYTKKSGTSITSASYDAAAGKISVVSQNGSVVETAEMLVALTSQDLSMSNATYEAKAKAYETAGASEENYHVLLAGSSSFEFWSNSATALSPIVSYNHAIGGTTAADWSSKLLDRLVVPYSPKAILFYAGINDLVNSSLKKEVVAANVQSLLESAHAKLPNAHLFYVYINRLPGYYLGYDADIAAINASLTSFIAGKSWIEGIDAGKVLLKSSGEADAAYFRLDNLHMSEYGYVLWGLEIKKALKAYLG